MAIVMFALSLTIYKILQVMKNAKNFDLENECQGQGVEEWDLHHSTGNIRIYTREFSIFFATWQYTFTQKITKKTHTTQTHVHTQHTDRVMTIGKICKADFTKNYL